MMLANSQQWPWGRIISGTVAVAILGVSVLFLVTGIQAQLSLKARPIRLKVDLSRPGTYTGKLNHVFSSSVANYLEIVTKSPLKSPKDAVKGLTGQLTISEPGGAVVAEASFGPEFQYLTSSDDNRRTSLIYFPHLAEGVYDLKLTVKTGAPKLAGVAHSLEVGYLLTGVEHFVADVLCSLGIAGCVVSGLIGLVIAAVTAEKRCRPVADKPVCS